MFKVEAEPQRNRQPATHPAPGAEGRGAEAARHDGELQSAARTSVPGHGGGA